MLAGPQSIDFNISHTDGIMLCALTRNCDIGVDVEYISPLSEMEDICRQFFCPEETAALLSLPRDQRTMAFYRCWVRKEAYVKAVGTGLATPLDCFQVAILPEEPARIVHITRDEEDVTSWTLADIDVSDTHAAAVAYRGPERKPSLTYISDPMELLAYATQMAA